VGGEGGGAFVQYQFYGHDDYGDGAVNDGDTHGDNGENDGDDDGDVCDNDGDDGGDNTNDSDSGDGYDYDDNGGDEMLPLCRTGSPPRRQRRSSCSSPEDSAHAPHTHRTFCVCACA
jgi:hypothetical protein